MSSDVVIRVDDLGKAYRIKHQHHDHVTLAQVALDRVRHPMRRNVVEEFWALRGVSFEVHKGEVLGVIGRNGAGKSTLLKVLTRITAPSSGRIDIWGRVGSLLEVGTGFHPELTGRENVYLNGSILGMTRKEIDGQFDAIVEFADVERFLDTPVKRYSSGMYVRLAFAVAAHLETEILLVDEVLAVGDQRFQQKCLEKIRSVATSGRTVLFVSHQMSSITQICDRAILLRGGELAVDDGTVEGSVEAYRLPDPGSAVPAPIRREGTGELVITGVTAVTPVVDPEVAKVLDITIERRAATADRHYVAVVIRNDLGEVAAHIDSRAVDVWPPDEPIATVRVTLTHPWLLPGTYTTDVSIHSHGLIDRVQAACSFEVIETSPYPGAVPSGDWNLSPILAEYSVQVVDGALADATGPKRDAGA